MIDLNQLAREIHQNSKEHGWWDKKRSFSEIIALAHSELSEALEEDRFDRPDEWYGCSNCAVGEIRPCFSDTSTCIHFSSNCCPYKDSKPEGKAVELIDCVIRILDYCGHQNIDVERLLLDKHKYNLTRPYKHGGKKY